MSSVVRRFRGLGVALAVLALSAGAVFASTPGTRLTSRALDVVQGQTSNADPSESESAEPSESPEASESESPEPSESAEPSGSPTASPSPTSHGALVSTAANMPTPAGFRNHGAFVSCVAHMQVSLVGFDWTTVTAASCGLAATASPAASASSHASPTGAAHGASGKAKAAAHRQRGH